jgi:hypothetical protein
MFTTVKRCCKQALWVKTGFLSSFTQKLQLSLFLQGFSFCSLSQREFNIAFFHNCKGCTAPMQDFLWVKNDTLMKREVCQRMQMEGSFSNSLTKLDPFCHKFLHRF